LNSQEAKYLSKFAYRLDCKEDCLKADYVFRDRDGYSWVEWQEEMQQQPCRIYREWSSERQIWVWRSTEGQYAFRAFLCTIEDTGNHWQAVLFLISSPETFHIKFSLVSSWCIIIVSNELNILNK
jgi:hypothetical protein